jgi:Rps23 Pro-64 3,4-dihydroxylase Tpa1-like proline 4-hydroxylase
MTNKNIDLIDNFLNENDHSILLEQLLLLKFKEVTQIKDEHYSHILRFEGDYFPNTNEIYSAKFNLIEDNLITESILSNFKRKLVELIRKKYYSKYTYFSQPVILKLNKSCYFRLHSDAYAGKIGYTYFLNKKWTYDHGGLLNFINSDKTIHPIMPISNRIIIRDEKEVLPHFLSSVEQWSDLEQFIIIGWINDEIGLNNNIIKNYQKLIA